jgi:hypothetical protein
VALSHPTFLTALSHSSYQLPDKKNSLKEIHDLSDFKKPGKNAETVWPD